MNVLPANKLARLADYDRGSYHVVLPRHVLTEDILKPAFWANHVRRLRFGDLVDVVTEDGQLDIQLRVLSVEPGMVHMRLRFGFESESRKADLAAAAAATQAAEQLAEQMVSPDGYKCGFTKANGYYVQLKATGEVLAKSLPDMRSAKAYANAHAAKAQQVAA